MTINKLITGLIFLSISFSSCQEIELLKDAPNCIEDKIRDLSNEEVQNPPAQVWEWKVDGATYYYISSDCCDQYNYLYDDNCSEVCAVDGGISGGGDGNCPEFDGPIEKTLIWEDDRN